MGENYEASILKEFLSCEDMDCADHDICPVPVEGRR